MRIDTKQLTDAPFTEMAEPSTLNLQTFYRIIDVSHAKAGNLSTTVCAQRDNVHLPEHGLTKILKLSLSEAL